MSACGASGDAPPEASEKAAIDRSVASVAEAEAAASTPMPVYVAPVEAERPTAKDAKEKS